MRKIIVSEFITLDGVIEAPGNDGSTKFAGWSMPYATNDTMKWKYDELFAADALLLGRVTYEGFAKAWPTMQGTGEFGGRMNGIQKYVVSTSLAEPAWNNSIVYKGNMAQIAKLKEGEGKDILVFGSSALSESLMAAHLIDEYRFLVYPVVLGEGKRFWKDGTHVKLKLSETQTFSSGVVLLRYVPDNT